MKKTLYLGLCAFIFCSILAVRTNAQTIVGVYITHGCDTESYYAPMSGYTPGNTLLTYFGDGTSETDPADSMAFFSHAYATAGSYTMKCILINPSGAHIDSTTLTDDVAICSTLSLTPYLDNNSNCLYDAGDGAILTPLTVEIDSAGVPLDTITATGAYYSTAYGVPAGTVYAFKLLTPPAGVVVSCPGSGIVYDTAGVSHGTRLMGFVCGSSSGFDLSEIVNVGGPGRHMSDVDVELQNAFCTAQTGTLTMTFSPKYNFSYAYPVPSSVVGNVITWNIPAISATAPVDISAHFDVPGAWLIPGDTIQSSYVLTPITGDLNPANNTIVRVDTVTASYDPNEKSVMPHGAVTAGTNLDYKIVFENTGNAPAQNIHVQDTLSNDLDIHSFKLESATAQVFTTISKDAAGHNVLKFDFPNINLLDSSHHGQCQGMVTFTINTKAGLPGGTVIYNQAGIYFDDNEVVMTDSAQTEIGITTGVTTMTNASKVAVYPNPVNDQLTVKTDGTYTSLTVTNTVGQLMMTQQINTAQTTVNVKGLPAGLYYLTLRGELGTKVVKFEKM